MIPRRISATNYGPYERIEWEIPEGLSAIVGHNLLGEGIDSNGAGKTLLLELIPLCLFGPSIPWSEKLSIGATEPCQVELEFEHGDSLYRVRRIFDPRGRGKTTTDLEVCRPLGAHDEAEYWEPLTRENQAETQRLIEDVIGLSETTFAHSVFAAQGARHFADASLAPRERKAILAEALDLAVWDRYLELVRADISTLEKRKAKFDAQAQAFHEELGKRDELETRKAMLTDSLSTAEAGVAAAEQSATAAEEAYATLQEGLRAVEQVRARQAEHATAAQKIENERQRLKGLADAEVQHQERLTAEALAHQAKATEITAESAALAKREAPTCDRCGQHVADEALTKMRQSLAADRQAHQERASELLAKSAEHQKSVVETWVKINDLVEPEPFLPTEEETALLESAPNEQQVRELKANVETARHAVSGRRSVMVEVEKSLARTEEALAGLAGLAERQKVAVDEGAELAVRLVELRALETAYGRNGIPALILEAQAIPQLELEAQRILEQLGLDYRVELQTQRETKTGTLKDTLDVLVHEPRGMRRYETYSGGERTRLEFALRIALARLVAQRSASEVSMLALDEMTYLDASGMAAVAQVLRGLTEFRTILVISHDERLVDSFDQQVTVVRDEHGSRLEEALVA